MSPSDTKLHLINQALLYFAQHDYERSTLDEIAKELGVTKGAIYHHFKNKDELFMESVRLIFTYLAKYMNEGMKAAGSFENYLKRMFVIEDVFDEISQASGIALVFSDYEKMLYMFIAGIKKFPELKQDLANIYDQIIKDMIVLMNRDAYAGKIRKDADFEAIAYEITAYYEGSILLSAVTGNVQFTILGPRVCSEIWNRLRPEKRED